jgi:hypothetical protein
VAEKKGGRRVRLPAPPAALALEPPAADDQVRVIFDGDQDELDDYLAELLVQLLRDPKAK